MRNKVVAVFLVFALVLAISACQRNNNGAPDQTPAAPPAGSPAASPASPAASPSGAAGNVNAEAVFKQNCIACHGADLHGGVGPNLTAVGSRLSSDAIAAKISAGGGGMTAFKGVLSDAEIHALADWLAAKKG
ncbi:c-type cytochrome [Cohnella candidum]|uniref:Cytochrome c n=1 Tax=Cohnella candidum TaxID=2674991 RepID=A0A3G3K055_9BACL|nr:cytochrome c [Cohnella candidum]AYQ73880.1 cytochrome c [Cohnella candidum]